MFGAHGIPLAMRPLQIVDSDTVVLALQREIRRSRESRYDHRLHGVLLVAQGMTAPDVGRLLGDSPRTVQYWVHRFEEDGATGLVEGDRSGRPRRLSAGQLRAVSRLLRGVPEDVGLRGAVWDGKALAELLRREWHIELGVRQCQRVFRQLRSRSRRPRRNVAAADRSLQQTRRKTR